VQLLLVLINVVKRDALFFEALGTPVSKEKDTHRK